MASSTKIKFSKVIFLLFFIFFVVEQIYLSKEVYNSNTNKQTN